jgi:hypothetical protein
MQKRYFADALLRVSGMGQKPKFIGVTLSCQGRRPEAFALEYFDDLYYIAGSETQQAAVRGASSHQWQDANGKIDALMKPARKATKTAKKKAAKKKPRS